LNAAGRTLRRLRFPHKSKRDQARRGTSSENDPVTASDTFSRFVDVLASSLDEHGATGEQLASRVHLSRYHLDRVVAAVAGEPPHAFRRRILLERAAFRLLTSEDSVLDVALEAGYASHEAFTRAFRRAYGRTPSEWRRHPSRFQIDAPSRVHFHPPGSLRVPARRKVTAMELLNRMVEHHVWLVGEMLARAGGLTDDVLDATIEISVEGIDDGRRCAHN
jgi:AraC family transcriptional regulator